MHTIKNIFNGGIVSPDLVARLDLDKPGKSLLECENFLPLDLGGVERRRGFFRLAELPEGVGETRLFWFSFGEDLDFMFVFYSGGAAIYRLSATPRLSALWLQTLTLDGLEPQLLNLAQEGDVLYLVDGVSMPRKISFSPGPPVVFSAESISTQQPFVDWETDSRFSLTLVGSDWKYLWTSGPNYLADLSAGDYFKTRYRKTASQVSQRFDLYGWESTPLPPTTTPGTPTYTWLIKNVVGGWSFTTTGTWTGTLFIDKSTDGGTTWEPYLQFVGNADRNISYEGSEDTSAWLRWYINNAPSSGSGHMYVSYVETEAYLEQTWQIDSAIVGGFKVLPILNPLAHTDYSNISLSAFNSFFGYPKALAFFKQRLCYGGTVGQPSTLFVSKQNDYEDFGLGDLATDGIQATMAGNAYDRISWMEAGKMLFIGTTQSEYLATGNAQGVFSPTTISIERNSAYGSSGRVHGMLGSKFFCVDSSGRVVRRFAYDYTVDAWPGLNLNLLCPQLISGQPTGFSASSTPKERLALVDEGVLHLALTDEAQNVMAWATISHTRGDIEASEFFTLDNTVFLAVVVDGGLEVLPFNTSSMLTDAVLDSAKIVDYAVATLVTELSASLLVPGATMRVHETGETFVAPATGNYTLLTPFTATTFTVGLPVVSKLTTAPLWAPQTVGKALNGVALSLIAQGSFSAGWASDNLFACKPTDLLSPETSYTLLSNPADSKLGFMPCLHISCNDSNPSKILCLTADY